MKLFLLHADTPYRTWREGLSLSDPRLHLSTPPLLSYESTRLIFALWCDKRLSNEDGWEDICGMLLHALGQTATLPKNTRVIFSLEDARPLLNHTQHRLKFLYDRGVRILTPMWQGENGIGGAYDTKKGLTPRGKELLALALEMGYFLDLSHASPASCEDILSLSQDRVLATHSCFYSVCPHPRNLPDHHAKELARRESLVGLSFVPSHLGGGYDALLSHIDHALGLGIQSSLCLGTDYDGTDTLPADFPNGVSDLSPLFSRLCSHFGTALTEGLYWSNPSRLLNALF